MVRLIALFIAFGLKNVVCAQSSLDSLLTVLKQPIAPSEKITAYGKVCWAYLGRSELDLAALYADSVRILATETADSSGIYKAGYYYGVIARLKADYSTALQHFHEYLRYHKSKGDSSRVAGVLYQIGTVHSHYGNYEKSLTALQRSLAIEEADENLYSVGYTLNTIGIIYKETKAYDNAIATFNKALSIFDSLEALSDKTDVLVNLGNAFSEKREFHKAMEYYHQALRIDNVIGKDRGVAVSLANIAYLFDRMKEYDSALVYHLKALSLREKLVNADDLARSLLGAGHGYLQLNKSSQANPYLSRALQIAREINSKPLQRDAHSNLARMHEQRGELQKSVYHYKQHEIFKDSILNEETAERISELEVKHEVADKIKQIALLEKENEIRQQEAQRDATLKKVLLAGIAVLIMIACLLMFVFRQRLLLIKKTREIEEANLRHQLSELKIRALQAQINPHFMFNCLNSINRMIVKGENEAASIYLKKFSKLVRLIVENGEANRVSLGDELALIESYIQLEELRFKGKIEYEIVGYEKIEKENTFIPPMILQPFIENSIWHGLTNKSAGERGHITIDVKEEDDTLVCIIEDNGVGREKSAALSEAFSEKTRSVGIGITEERLKLLSKDCPRNLVKIIDLKDAFNTATGTRVEIRIPLS